MHFDLADIQSITADWLVTKQLSLKVLRLDKIHPVISGNKWFKLKYYLEEAIKLNKTTIATFGGAWSNHIVASAYAAKEAGLNSIGIIRGEKPKMISYTLQAAVEYGMDLHFVSRIEFKNKEDIINKHFSNDLYWINEGGYGVRGAKGAAEILEFVNLSEYSHIIAAVGTGTMLAGIINRSSARHKIIGISSMKGNYTLNERINYLIQDQSLPASYQLMHDYHFGGYAKHPQQLIDFINQTYQKHNLPLDIVYTGKTFFAIKDLAEKGFFARGSKLLMIHSGGLQGNESLPVKVLSF